MQNGTGRIKRHGNRRLHGHERQHKHWIDVEGGVKFLQWLAKNNPSAFAGLLGKVLPTTRAADESSGGLNVKITFERHIVFPDGRKQVEEIGHQAQQALPAPELERDIELRSDE